MADPIRQWLRARPLMTDLAVALVCFVLVAPVTAATAYHQNASIPVYLVLLAISCVPLLARSRWPVQVASATVLIGVVEFVLVPVNGPPPAAVGFALFAVATRTDRRTAWRSGACAAVALTTAGLFTRPGVEDLPQNLGLIAWTCLSVAVGDAVRSRRELLASAMERAERAERTREEEARRRVTEERMRIARELHDVVAHHITLVNAQAGVAHHLMRTDPEHAYQALERIRDTSRAALDELRATVGLLRNSGEQSAPREPAPGLAGLDDLLEAFRHSGLPVRLERAGTPVELPPITDLTAYRIIQEALTNSHKHAGPASARVRLEFGADTLRLTVEDDGRSPVGRGTGPLGAAAGPGAGPGAGTGHGMIGMHERARAAGGTLAAGPRPGGGFRIHAELPLPAGTGRKGCCP
ncbi:histidine kinase [Kitasatospora sp. NBC_00240]|uniref:sensor histidine kinase n=1 Tax=Kitasatospora sp. NBC_00240 TaxID=2903567 RepID=UPI00224E9C49|nr:histidine kinase [Kitasatospora sp. NBC_00240]MCX5211945.1 histidine kinase [Kitasatospora sp. NBC_00240]